jgi:hypothetical protein
MVRPTKGTFLCLFVPFFQNCLLIKNQLFYELTRTYVLCVTNIGIDSTGCDVRCPWVGHKAHCD